MEKKSSDTVVPAPGPAPSPSSPPAAPPVVLLEVAETLEHLMSSSQIKPWTFYREDLSFDALMAIAPFIIAHPTLNSIRFDFPEGSPELLIKFLSIILPAKPQFKLLFSFGKAREWKDMEVLLKPFAKSLEFVMNPKMVLDDEEFTLVDLTIKLKLLGIPVVFFSIDLNAGGIGLESVLLMLQNLKKCNVVKHLEFCSMIQTKDDKNLLDQVSLLVRDFKDLEVVSILAWRFESLSLVSFFENVLLMKSVKRINLTSSRIDSVLSLPEGNGSYSKEICFHGKIAHGESEIATAQALFKKCQIHDEVKKISFVGSSTKSFAEKISEDLPSGLGSFRSMHRFEQTEKSQTFVEVLYSLNPLLNELVVPYMSLSTRTWSDFRSIRVLSISYDDKKLGSFASFLYLNRLEDLSVSFTYLKSSSRSVLLDFVSNIASIKTMEKLSIKFRHFPEDPLVMYSLLHEFPFIRQLETYFDVVELFISDVSSIFRSLALNYTLDSFVFNTRSNKLAFYENSKPFQSFCSFLSINSTLTRFSPCISIEDKVLWKKMFESLKRNASLLSFSMESSSIKFYRLCFQLLSRNWRFFRTRIIVTLLDLMRKQSSFVCDLECIKLILQFFSIKTSSSSPSSTASPGLLDLGRIESSSSST